MEIADEKLQRLFDMIIHSLDFGSGFLEDDDVVLLRDIAKQLGVNPQIATPDDFRSQYNHVFEQHSARAIEVRPERAGECAHCRKSIDAPCHKGEMKE